MLGGDDGERRVPAIARRNQDSIDVLPREQLELIVVHLAAAVSILFVDDGLDFLAPLVAHVANCDESRPVDIEKFAEDMRTARADADASESDLVAGGNSPCSLAENH